MPRLSELRSAYPHAVESLATAITAGRVHHAYLLVGPDADHIERLVSAVAASLVCSDRTGADACGRCPSCTRASAGTHPDVLALLPNDKDAIPVDAVRELTARLSLRATMAATKVVRVLGAERMNAAAQNALLKTLEEPRGPTCFLIGVNRPRAMLITVRSRCQTLRVRSAPTPGAAAALEASGVEQATAQVLAELVGASVGRAQSLMEAGAAGALEELCKVLVATEVAPVLRAASELGSERHRADVALALLEVMIRDSLARIHGANPPIRGVGLEALGGELLARLAGELQRLRAAAAFNLNRTLALETLLLDLTAPARAANGARR